MEDFIKQYPAFVYMVFLTLVGLIWWLIRMGISEGLKKVKDQALQMKDHELRMNEIENNYTEEIKKIRVEANDRHLEVLGVLTEVRVEISEIKMNKVA